MANDNDRDDKIELQGTVIETNKGIFKVKVSDEHIITARLAGRLKINDIKVIVGDLVLVEVSPYNLNLGRVSRRLKN